MCAKRPGVLRADATRTRKVELYELCSVDVVRNVHATAIFCSEIRFFVGGVIDDFV